MVCQPFSRERQLELVPIYISSYYLPTYPGGGTPRDRRWEFSRPPVFRRLARGDEELDVFSPTTHVPGDAKGTVIHLERISLPPNCTNTNTSTTQPSAKKQALSTRGMKDWFSTSMPKASETASSRPIRNRPLASRSACRISKGRHANAQPTALVRLKLPAALRTNVGRIWSGRGRPGHPQPSAQRSKRRWENCLRVTGLV